MRALCVQDDLSNKIAALSKVLDCDDGGTLSYLEMHVGLKKMAFRPPIAITQDEFALMTK